MSQDFAAARQTMVDTQVRVADVTDPHVQTAMRAVPREAYCGANVHLAYADAPVEYAPGYALLRPRDVGKLLQAVHPRPGEKALTIHAPYAAAVLAAIGLDVESHDGVLSIIDKYDVIITEGAVPEAPASWREALALGGRLAVIERNGAVGKAKLYVRSEEGVGSRIVFDAQAPLLPGFEPTVTFAL
jgi:protein-L-isoaspartate(D-aspartate) O-methyltransferase